MVVTDIVLAPPFTPRPSQLLGMIISFLCAILAVSGGIAPGLAGLALMYSLDVTTYLKVMTD